MRTSFSDKLETGRDFTSSRTSDTFGAFVIQGPCGERLRIIACDGESPDVDGWEHVSVSTHRRVPNWREMCFIKDLFWSEDEWVVQFHPAHSEYVNNHPFVLHLWRKSGFPTPPSNLVGYKSLGVLKLREST